MNVAMIILAMVALATTFVEPAAAQSGRKMARVGMLWSSAAEDQTSPIPLEAFRAALREHGYDEGRNLSLEHRYFAGRLDRFPSLAADLVQAKVDVILASSPLSIRAARQATSTIPIVMINGDPEMFSNMSRPGGNVTGLTAFQAELAGKQVELLREAVPKLAKVALLRNPTQPVHALKLKEAETVARALGPTVHVVTAQTAAELEPAFTSMAKERVGGVVVFADGTYSANRGKIADLALRHGLPSVFGSPGAAEAGGLISYLPSREESYRRAGSYVGRILKGAHAGDLPIEQPTRFELSINLRTARTLRVALPQALVVRADRLIE